jgi:hypothetical protein
VHRWVDESEVSGLAVALKLLERQLGLWELRSRLEDLGSRSGRCLEGHVAYGPCLLVSRERGSAGSLVARQAAERLGWHVFDREIVDEIAQLAHVRQRLVETVDAETRSKWKGAWQPELKPDDIGYEQYLGCLRQVVLSLGHHGDVVILGRGAQYLLPAQCGLRVRIVAPLELRVTRVRESGKVPLPEAQALVQEFDANQKDFIKRCFQRDSNSALNYDLVVNTGEITVEAAVAIVLLAMGHKLGVWPSKR